jgi:hypothetical protein
MKLFETTPTQEEFDTIIESIDDIDKMIEFASQVYSYIYNADRARGHKVMPPSKLYRPVFMRILREDPEKALEELSNAYKLIMELVKDGVLPPPGRVLTEEKTQTYGREMSARELLSEVAKELDSVLPEVGKAIRRVLDRV